MIIKNQKINLPTTAAESGSDPVIDYKNLRLLHAAISDSGKIMPGRHTDVSHKNQRQLARAIKIARSLALLSYTDKYSNNEYHRTPISSERPQAVTAADTTENADENRVAETEAAEVASSVEMAASAAAQEEQIVAPAANERN